ncbi:hypothetical protein [Dialister succinatiphilus]|uniref:hypothetical protein n=1 Tax=Dialister succinatiphilus TaxID=487173 RepID=UPI003AB42EBA
MTDFFLVKERMQFIDCSDRWIFRQQEWDGRGRGCLRNSMTLQCQEIPPKAGFVN